MKQLGSTPFSINISVNYSMSSFSNVVLVKLTQTNTFETSLKLNIVIKKPLALIWRKKGPNKIIIYHPIKLEARNFWIVTHKLEIYQKTSFV